MAAPPTDNDNEWFILNQSRENAPQPPGQNSKYVIKRFHGLTDLFYARCTYQECLLAHSNPNIPMNHLKQRIKKKQQQNKINKNKQFQQQLKRKKNPKTATDSNTKIIKIKPNNNNKLKVKKNKFDFNHGTMYHL